jgi:hypothetical protein
MASLRNRILFGHDVVAAGDAPGCTWSERAGQPLPTALRAL